MITIKNLSKHYEQTIALNHVDFEFSDSSVTAIMGENGAGKSTLLKICAGVMSYQTGTILVDGQLLQTHATEIKRKLGYLPEMPSMYERLTGREFLSYIASLRQMTEGEEEIARLSSVLGMNRFLDYEIGSYSKGMKQKVSILSAIMHDPIYLFLDEPVWGLDPLTAKTLQQFITQRTKTTVIATHSPDLVEQVADYVYFLSHGTVLTGESIETILTIHGSIQDAYFHEVRVEDA